MPFTFTTTVCRTTVDLKQLKHLDFEAFETNPVQVQNDQRNMREFFNGVVNQHVPPDMLLLNTDSHLYVNPGSGVWRLDDIGLTSSIQMFISSVRLTSTRKRNFTFIVNLNATPN